MDEQTLIPQRELFVCLFEPDKVRLMNYILGGITLKAREKSCQKTVIWANLVHSFKFIKKKDILQKRNEL